MEIDRARFAYRIGDQRLNAHTPLSTPHPVARERVRPGGSDLCFRWPGTVDEARAHLTAHDVPIELGPVERQGAAGVGMSLYFRDPDGSLLELICYPEDGLR